MANRKTIPGSIAVLLALSLFVAASRAQEAASTAQTGDSTDVAAAEPSQPAPAANGVSGVRIVRLSQVKGEVLLDRKTDRGFETAFANLPIAQGQRLQTKEGVAEVEFEDNSTLRITPDSLIEFPALQRGPSGATATSVKLLKGILYVSLANTKGSQFIVTLGNETLTLAPSSHIRLDTDTAKSSLAVFNGSVQVADSSGTTMVGKKKAVVLNTTQDASAGTPPVIGKVEHELFDEWDKNAADYHKLRSVPAAFASSSYLYGINDLNYYGSFSNGGCGTMWRPYFTSAAWDPFANGVWAWYPGTGYSWVSPYPWGWTPFHYGSWEYCPSGGGWGWRPGGNWIGLSNQPATTTMPRVLNQVHGTAYPKPPHAPAAGSSTLVVVSTRPLPISKLSSPDTFTFRKDSAGLGVPRESLGKLSKVSQGVAQHGSVSTTVSVPVASPQGGREPNASNAAVPTVHNMHVNNMQVNDPSAASRSSVAASASRSNNASSNAGQATRQSEGGIRGASQGSYSGGGSGGGGGSRMSVPAPSPAPPSAGSSPAGTRR